MRVVLKECARAPLGDALVLVRDPREALTIADPDGQVAALLDELRKGPATAADLSAALSARGVGSSLVQCLAGLGVGAMTIVDRDDVEPRNFARQFLYRHRDVGRSKVARAAEWVRDYDPDIEVRPVERWITGPGDLTDLVVDLRTGLVPVWHPFPRLADCPACALARPAVRA